MNIQHDHNSATFTPRSFPITVVCDGLQSPANLGSLFRLCDAFGIKEVVLCGSHTNLDTPRLRRTSRATMASLRIRQWESTKEYVAQLEPSKYLTIALEYSTESQAIDAFNLTPNLPLLLFIGNESNGVSQLVLDWVAHTLHIDMFGINSSMNVTQAAGIALYELTQKLLGQR
ncbi:MAG: TrmH family RNA methyltransferase [Gilvibacter sp.]